MMKVVLIVDDKKCESPLINEHGLSIYIETKNRKILFDTGSSDAFLKNAKTLGINLDKVDIFVLSHSHYDHAGGLTCFDRANKTAKKFISKNYNVLPYSRKNDGLKFIGIDEKLDFSDKILCESFQEIDENLFVISPENYEKQLSFSNCKLFKKVGNNFINDDFSHEQSLVIRENDNLVLICGCAHMGVMNIINEVKLRFGKFPNFVIGGFHTVKEEYSQREVEELKELSHNLLETNAKFFTCHCTGDQAFFVFKDVLKEKIEYFNLGKTLII